MNNFAKTLRNIDSRILNFGYLALAFLGTWIDHWFYFICLFIAAALISTLKFFHDKKWIAATDKYTRTIVVTSFLK